MCHSGPQDGPSEAFAIHPTHPVRLVPSTSLTDKTNWLTPLHVCKGVKYIIAAGAYPQTFTILLTKNFTDIFGKKWFQEQFPGGACPQTPLAAVPLLGLDQLCWHNFENNRHLKELGIMLE